MANILEVIFQGVDQLSPSANKATESTNRLGRAIENGPNVSLRSLRRAAIVAVAALYGLERGIESIAKRAGELGFKNVANDFDTLKASVQQLSDALLTSPLFGSGDNKQNILTVLDQGFLGLITVARAAGVAFEFVAGGLDLIYLGAQRLLGVEAELFGATTKYTEAWYENAKAQAIAAHNAAIGAIWEGKYTDSIKQNNGVLLEGQHNLDGYTKGQLAEVATLEDRIKAQKQLNKAMTDSMQIQDDIRRGDALALNNDLKGGGSGGGGAPFRGTGRAGGGTGNGAPSSGEHITVIVNLGGREISHLVKPAVRSVIHNELFKKNASDAGKHPGKDQ